MRNHTTFQKLVSHEQLYAACLQSSSKVIRFGAPRDARLSATTHSLKPWIGASESMTRYLLLVSREWEYFIYNYMGLQSPKP